MLLASNTVFYNCFLLFLNFSILFILISIWLIANIVGLVPALVLHPVVSTRVAKTHVAQGWWHKHACTRAGLANKDSKMEFPAGS